ncbi:AI-2E family transporter [Adhaeribacter aerolatus]|uniref:AI-2E family transporter n=1 Tax=Adhaeribacter aerolatus TaxID=670289 RepID=A0A512B3Q3_9BACT|nr:AI-2E family transporter [Adhaeribacter aerolatus]GEO06581.1 AI-2E family transporter [Adhaeribacter aerolatus]
MARPTTLQKFNRVMLAFLLFFTLLHLGAPFLKPLAIGGLFAMLLVPVSRKLEKWGLKRLWAAIISVVAIVIVLVILLILLIHQIGNLTSDLPELGKTLADKLEQVHAFIIEKFNLTNQQQLEYIRQELKISVELIASYLKTILRFSGTILIKFILVMILTAVFLFYRTKLKNFVFMLFGAYQHHDPYLIVAAEGTSHPSAIINDIAQVANSYIAGVFLVTLILSVVNTIGLMVIGLEHALFFGLLAGILNIIPYVGSVGGSLIPVIYALLTRDSWSTPLIIGVFFLVVQLSESYFLTPNITGAKVRLNPMAIIIGLLLGGFIWGVAGMILVIPYLGIAKVIFDHVNKLRPYGYLLGKDENGNGT